VSHGPDPSGSEMYGELLRQQDYFHEKIAELEKTIQQEREVSKALLEALKSEMKPHHGWCADDCKVCAAIALAERPGALASSEDLPADTVPTTPPQSE
jgi:hypothetical protein